MRLIRRCGSSDCDDNFKIHIVMWFQAVEKLTGFTRFTGAVRTQKKGFLGSNLLSCESCPSNISDLKFEISE